ncbi:ABC transporter substrate-binding protein [Streptomyces blattellae]|uniref:ABC transporter substrate-binding protein n=1 Tax=Streptomyces blattellae TaxID=2569855 RepID=UPI0018AD0201|nr:ABC transporter substrate-binding protein [Streptomyces blattellae]
MALGGLIVVWGGDGGDAEADALTSSGGASGGCTTDRVGGDLAMGVQTPVSALDPVRSQGSGSSGGIEVNALYDTLVRYDTQNDTYVPVVARSLTPNADFTQWTLKLRDTVTFGNGNPLTAEAVKQSFARHQDPANRSSMIREAQEVKTMDVVNERTLVFHLDESWARFPSLLASAPGMVTDPEVVEAQGDQFSVNPLGAGVGPYEVEQFTPGGELVLKAKDNWWGGPVCIQTLRFAAGGATTQDTYDAYKAGDIQLAFMRGPEVIAQAEQDGVEGFHTLDNAGHAVTVNHAPGRATADPLVRQALAAALDPEAIDQLAKNGYGTPTSALIYKDSILYDGAQGPATDPVRARELVAEAKANGWDGNLDMPCVNGQEIQLVCAAVKESAEASGITVTVETVTGAQFGQRIQQGDFDIISRGLSLSDADPSMRLSAAVGTGGGANVSGYSDPELDAAISALQAAPDLPARQKAMDDIQALWNETIPAVVFGGTDNFIGVSDEVHGIKLSQDALIYFDKAYIDG